LFEKALMQEHFNENYMESDQFPKTKFEGEIIDFSLDKIQQETTFTIEGELTVHGKTESITTTGTLLKQGETILLATNFSVLPSTYNIKIPNLVKDKIAGKINIKANFNLIER
jgi:polyisoprenoid-binding protein YceI